MIETSPVEPRAARAAFRAKVVGVMVEWMLQTAPSRALRMFPVLLGVAVCGLYAVAPGAPVVHRPIGLLTIADLAALWPLVKDTAFIAYILSLLSTCDKVFALAHNVPQRPSGTEFA